MKKRMHYGIIIIIAISLISLCILAILSFSERKGTYSLENEETTGIVISCPEVARRDSIIDCSVTLNVKSGDNINGISAVYDFATGITYESFVPAVTCAENATNCMLVSESTGFVIGNLTGYTANQKLGTLKLALADTLTLQTSYKVGLKDISLSNSEFDDIDLAAVSTNVKIANNDASLKKFGKSSSTNFTGFSKTKYDGYSIEVNSDIDTITIYATATDSKATVAGAGDVNLHYGTNAINVVVTAEDGITTNTYTVNVKRKYEYTTDKYKIFTNNSKRYIYTGSNHGTAIIANIGQLPDGLSCDIEEDKLQIKYNNEVLDELIIANFASEYQIYDNKFQIGRGVTYGAFKEKVTSEMVTIKVYNSSNQVVTSDDIEILDTFKVKMTVGTNNLAEYGFSEAYISFDNTLVIDTTKNIIKRLNLDTSYTTLKQHISTNGTISFVSASNQQIQNENATIKTGDKVIITTNDNAVEYTISVSNDINGDGKVDFQDVSIAYSHHYYVNMLTTPDPTYQGLSDVAFSAGEVNGDGKIDFQDVSIIYSVQYEREHSQ